MNRHLAERRGKVSGLVARLFRKCGIILFTRSIVLSINKSTGYLNIALGIKDAGSCNPRKWVNQGQISPQTTYVSSVVAKGDDADALAKLYDDWCDQILLHGGDASRPSAASVGVWLPLVATVLFLLRGVWVR